MKIYGLWKDYSLYDKINISAEDFFNEYEFNVEEVFAGVVMRNKVCKSLQRAADMLWLEEYLRIIGKDISLREVNGEGWTHEEVFAQYKLVCIRDTLYCRYGIDIFEGLDKKIDFISKQSKCYKGLRCELIFYYMPIHSGEELTGYRFFSNDVYNYEKYLVYVRQDGWLRIVPFTHDSRGIYIEPGYVTDPDDVVIWNNGCYYNGGGIKEECNSTASGAYLSNGRYIISISPEVSSERMKIALDGEFVDIDGDNIKYEEGQLIFKNAYNYNNVRLTGCPSFYEKLSTPCLYSFSMTQQGENMVVSLNGEAPYPDATDMSLFLNNVELPSGNYDYDSDNGTVTIPITDAYYQKAFSLQFLNCKFNFSLTKESEEPLIITPTVTPFTYELCNRCDKTTYEVTYILDPDAAIENTYKAVHTPVSTVLNGCRETYDEVLFFCQEGKKYRKVNVWEKCFGDTEWVMDSEGDPVEMSDPEECAESTPPQDFFEYVYLCEGTDYKKYKRNYTWDNDAQQYTYSDVYEETVGRCGDPPQLEEIIYKCEDGSLNEYTRTWVWNNNLNQYTYSDEYVKTVGRCGDPPQLEEIIYKCEDGSLNEYTRTWVWDNNLNQYTYSDEYVRTVGSCEQQP